MEKIYNESDIRHDYRKLTKLLIERGMTITTMESATSGQIASLITDTEGSSAVLKGAFVTYCNEAKSCRVFLSRFWKSTQYIRRRQRRLWRKLCENI